MYKFALPVFGPDHNQLKFAFGFYSPKTLRLCHLFFYPVSNSKLLGEEGTESTCLTCPHRISDAVTSASNRPRHPLSFFHSLLSQYLPTGTLLGPAETSLLRQPPQWSTTGLRSDVWHLEENTPDLNGSLLTETTPTTSLKASRVRRMSSKTSQPRASPSLTY